MTPDEIRAWLGIPEGRAPAPWLVAALAPLPLPGYDDDAAETYRTFMRAADAAGIKRGRRGMLAAYAPKEGETQQEGRQ